LLRGDDLTMFPVNHPAGAIVTSAHPGLVDTVLVAGQVVKRDGPLCQARLRHSPPDN
jgi:5-methylthioadenosine/S-adenosylhomocysteine deaminase